MLWLTRAVFREECGDKNCIVFDLPDGRRIRFWITESRYGSRGQVAVGIEAPKDVSISRGELLPDPMDYLPTTQPKQETRT